MNDTRNANERIEDAAFENRIRRLTAARKWNELRAVFVVYGSALHDREESDDE